MPENESSNPSGLFRPDISPGAAVSIKTDVDNQLHGVEVPTNNSPEIPQDSKDDGHGGYKNEGSTWSIDTTPKIVPAPDGPLATPIPRPEAPTISTVESPLATPIPRPESSSLQSVEAAVAPVVIPSVPENSLQPTAEMQGPFSTITTATDTGEAAPDNVVPFPGIKDTPLTPEGSAAASQAPAEITPINRTVENQATAEANSEASSDSVQAFKQDVGERIINFSQKKVEIEAKRKQIDEEAAAKKLALTEEEKVIDADKAKLESIMRADDDLIANIINHTRRDDRLAA